MRDCIRSTRKDQGRRIMERFPMLQFLSALCTVEHATSCCLFRSTEKGVQHACSVCSSSNSSTANRYISYWNKEGEMCVQARRSDSVLLQRLEMVSRALERFNRTLSWFVDFGTMLEKICVTHGNRLSWTHKRFAELPIYYARTSRTNFSQTETEPDSSFRIISIWVRHRFDFYLGCWYFRVSFICILRSLHAHTRTLTMRIRNWNEFRSKSAESMCVCMVSFLFARW